MPVKDNMGYIIMRPLRIGLVAFTVISSSFLCEGANATITQERPPEVFVKIHDLDLSTVTGVKTAQARIRRAAESVCGDYPHIGMIVPVGIRRCRAQAIQDAERSLATSIAANRRHAVP